MASVFAIGPKVRGFKPELGNVFLRAIKIRSTLFFGGVVKPEAPCRKILRDVRDGKYEQQYFARPNSSLSSPFLLLATT
jgi:hypothetical protein